MGKLGWSEFTNERGEEISPVGLLEGVGIRMDFRRVRDDSEIDSRLGLGAVYDFNKDKGEYWVTKRVFVAAEVLTDGMRYVLTVEDELLGDNESVNRTYWLAEHDLFDPLWSGSSRLTLGKGFWGKLAKSILPDIGVGDLFELERPE